MHWFDTIDSTNDQLKKLAISGAPHGTVLVAGHQTKGRGRMGRSFHCPKEKGLYLSALLRPNCPAEALMHLTCAAAIAAEDAIELVTGFRPSVKWINDLVAQNKKLGGILTELSVDTKTGIAQSAVIGIGINCNQAQQDFPLELQDIAISLQTVTGSPVSIDRLAAALITSLQTCASTLLSKKSGIMAKYRRDCITLGRDIAVLQGDAKRYGTAQDINEDGSLIVRFQDGIVESVCSGEVSVRGMYGYV